MDEKEFLSDLEKKSRRFFYIGNRLERTGDPGEEMLSYFKNTAHNLETFLDEPYRARGNQTFVYFGELVASLRWFGKAAAALKHLVRRYETYHLEESAKEQEEFLEAAEKSFKFYQETIRNLYRDVKQEASRLGLKEAKGLNGEDFNLDRKGAELALAQNIEKEFVSGAEEKVLNTAFKYVSTSHEMEELLEEGKIEECHLEEIMSSFHRLQSGYYGNYIKDTLLEEADRRLKTLHGHITICLHLAEIAIYLLHFYERHENKIRHSETREKIAAAIAPEQLSRNIRKFSIHHLNRYSQKGRKVAEALLSDYANMVFKKETIILPKGSILHLRPAKEIVEPVRESKKPCIIVINHKQISCGDVIPLLIAFGEIAEQVEKEDVEMILQGDGAVVDKVKKNFLAAVLQTPR